MDKKITSVSDLLKDMGIDENVRKNVDKEIEDHRLGKSLTILRMQNNLSQAEMAKKLGVSQPWVSRIEYASNNQIKLGDLNKYTSALGYETILTISKPKNIAQKIKNTYNQLSALLSELQNYAVDDDSILQGVAKFELEATHNMLNLASALIESSSSKLNKIYPQHETQVVFDDSIVEKKKMAVV